ncbi:hypothetical protein OF846_002874 [Rhodotorula toruloides]|nr:hypothetical protein OF846_002874 [Rhodotorula toruloides]
MSPRRPPPQPIRIPRRQGRTNVSTNHAAIPTFTRRLPKQIPQAPGESSASAPPDSPVDLRVVPAQYESRPASTNRLAEIAVDIQPPTPEAVERPSQRRSAEAAAALRALKQSHRTASVYSSSSSNGTLEIATTQVGRQGGVYLRPDLSGKSNLTLDQLPRTVSLEDLVIHEVGKSDNEEDTLASSTVAAEDVNHRPISLTHAAPSTDLPTRTSSLSRSSSLVPLAGQNIPPPRYQSRPTPPSSLPPRASHPSPPSSRPPRSETEAERFKRLYLCPWEGSSPKALLRRSGREDAPGSMQEKEVANEKGLPFHVGCDIQHQGTRRTKQERKRLALKIGLGLLVLALFVDLIALNVRVWSLRDAYYDE